MSRHAHAFARLGAGLLAVAAATAQSPAPAAPAAPPAALRIVPSVLQLDDADDAPRVVALATTASGIARDATAEADWSLAGDAAELQRAPDGSRRLHGRHAGEALLRVRCGEVTAQVPVHVRGTAPRPPSFRNDVLPIFTHAGCNAGSCHGAAAGKNGFLLSLFAYDPLRDHRMLTRDLRGRRLDPGDPAHSLLLQKASAQVPHQGGKRLPADGADFARVRDWIAGGADDDGAQAPALAGIDLEPTDAVLVVGSRLPLRLRARYQDGSDRDATALALWSSGNEAAAAVDADGIVTAAARGEAVLLARFGGAAVTARVQVLADDAPFHWPEPPATNVVDREVHAKLRRARVLPAAVCDDAVFVRRVHLDLCGRLPSASRVQAFVADGAADKRARLVDELLARPEFAQVQAQRWAEVLRVDAEHMEAKGAHLMTRWLADGFAAGRPFDDMVRELLTASGTSFRDAAVNFWLVAEQPPQLAEHVAQNFLGVRMQCAQCHNHPFENWTMDDYYGFAAFFAQVARKRGEDQNEQVVWDRGGGDVRNKRDDKVAAPRYLGGGAAAIPAGTDRRRALAAWLTSPANDAFARNVANRLWAGCFGRGLVDPPDDVRVSNPASHPELLQALADQLRVDDFDLRPLLRTICTSRTYQLAAPAEPQPAALYAGNQVRRLSAEQLLQAIADVTGVPDNLPGVPAGGGPTQLASGRTPVRFLELFGRPTRESACTCERRDEPTLGQALHLINGDTIAAKLLAKDGFLQQALRAGTAPESLLDQLFLRAYARLPQPGERNHLLAPVRAAADDAGRNAVWQDIAWAILNSHEFLFQH